MAAARSPFWFVQRISRPNMRLATVVAFERNGPRSHGYGVVSGGFDTNRIDGRVSVYNGQESGLTVRDPVAHHRHLDCERRRAEDSEVSFRRSGRVLDVDCVGTAFDFEMQRSVIGLHAQFRAGGPRYLPRICVLKCGRQSQAFVGGLGLIELFADRVQNHVDGERSVLRAKVDAIANRTSAASHFLKFPLRRAAA